MTGQVTEIAYPGVTTQKASNDYNEYAPETSASTVNVKRMFPNFKSGSPPPQVPKQNALVCSIFRSILSVMKSFLCIPLIFVCIPCGVLETDGTSWGDFFFDQYLASILVTTRNSSCGEVMFSQACVKNSVHGGGVSQHSFGQSHSPLGRHPTFPSPPSTTGYSQQADGTHPTGMHSCFLIYLKYGTENS